MSISIPSNTKRDTLYLVVDEINQLIDQSLNASNVTHLEKELLNAKRTVESKHCEESTNLYASIAYNVALALVKYGHRTKAVYILQETIKLIYDLKPIPNHFSIANVKWYISAYSKLLQRYEYQNNPSSFLLYLKMGGLLSFCWMTQGEWPLALEILRKVQLQEQDPSLDSPTMAKVYLLMAITHIALNNLTDALECLDIAETRDTQLKMIPYWRAYVHLYHGNYTQVRFQIQKSLEIFSYSTVNCLNVNTLAELMLGNVHQAGEYCKRAIEMDFHRAISLFNIAMIYQQIQRPDATLQMLQYLKELQPFSTLPKPKLDTSIFQLFVPSSLFHGNWKVAEELNCSSYIIAFHLAQAAIHQKEWVTAEECLRFCYETASPSSEWVPMNLPSKALKLCNEVLQVVEEDLEILFFKSDALLCLERAEESKSNLDIALNVISSTRQCTNLKDDLCIKKKLKWLEEMEIQVYNNMALLHSCNDEIDKAMECLKKCLSIDPQRLQPIFNMCILLWRSNKKTAACTSWLEARGIPLNETKDYYLKYIERIRIMKRDSAVINYDSHVRGQPNVDQFQLCLLDTLLLEHWITIHQNQMIQSAIQLTNRLIESTKT